MKDVILTGDALEVLETLPDKSINCCVTSPPYWGLRDYGVNGQIGLEQTPDEYVTKMVEVFREVRRVLKDDGTLWLNLGDSYAANRPGGQPTPTNTGNKQGHYGVTNVPQGMKPKDLIGIPWLVAFALRADGWYLRSDIIWHKPNPLPESVKDRPTKAHEYIFLLSKSQKYYYDMESIKEQIQGSKGNSRSFRSGGSYTRGNSFNNSALKGRETHGNTLNESGFRNRRSVWTVAPKPLKAAHFATFPPDLIKPCILAGCPEGGTVLDPFFGAGTTGVVCKELGRSYIGIELNPEYVEMSSKRIAGGA